MSETAGTVGKSETGKSFATRLLLVLAYGFGLAAFLLAIAGWTIGTRPATVINWGMVVLHSVRAMGLSDAPVNAEITDPLAIHLLQASQIFGAAFYLVVTVAVSLLAAVSVRFAEAVLGSRSRHDVVIGSGAAAREYAARCSRRNTHVAAELTSALGKSAKLTRSGDLVAQLRRSGAARAKRIVVDEGEDAATWQTAQTAARLCPKVDVLAFIRDPWINERLSRASPEARLRTFSYAGGVARQVMLAHPPYLLARRYKAEAQHILIFGFGPVGQAIAREFLITSMAASPTRMMITAIDPKIDKLKAEFLGRVPGLSPEAQKQNGLEQAIDIDFAAGDLAAQDEALAAFLKARSDKAEICAVYVAINNESAPLSFGMALRDRIEELGWRAPILICAQHGAGFSPVAQGVGSVGLADQSGADRDSALCDRHLSSFGSWTDALDGSGLFEPELDGYARTLHERYVEKFGSRTGASPHSSDAPWELLADEFRVANRRAAAHFRAKIDAVGYDLDRWLAGAGRKGRRTHELPLAGDLFDLESEAQMSALTDLEHRRWMVERSLNGWQYGPTRDNRKKLHPDMRPLANLSDEARRKDYENIKQVAEILKKLLADRKRKKSP